MSENTPADVPASALGPLPAHLARYSLALAPKSAQHHTTVARGSAASAAGPATSCR